LGIQAADSASGAHTGGDTTYNHKFCFCHIFFPF
jgi:hypothetical protein